MGTGKTLGLPFSWMGTKVKMRGVLLPIIESIPRELYVEPFGGAGGLFFGKPPERAEVFNDSNELIINAFRTLRNSETREQVVALLDATPMSRAVYYELEPIMRKYFVGEDYQFEKKRARLDEYSNEVAIAYAFLYVQNVGFQGSGFHRSFARLNVLRSTIMCRRSSILTRRIGASLRLAIGFRGARSRTLSSSRRSRL